ncbi:MAG: methylmalonyl Co-A mutase-associated GTPase MeaB [Rhodobacteraceae bacterium]|nr:methylmalonyl Co-A mutase-associated GTPase MeaB [Paracoccaceae bacterium]
MDIGQDVIDAILSGDRRMLARAITLVESTRDDHRAKAIKLIDALGQSKCSALRIGLSGTPGVGKSTFTESFGMMLVEKGLKVAVLAVDPSSKRTGGSILGDKTRMDRLSRHPNAFIRPSPSSAALGGVARRTREAISLCEAAGFDVVLVETVGVGQSEVMVADMTDLFLLLLAPAGGDELQGVKRGIMEIADLILINKADGELKSQALRTCADYMGALRLLRKRVQDPKDFPKAMTISALEEDGLETVWVEVETLSKWRRDKGYLDASRRRQAKVWFEDEVRRGVLGQLERDETLRNLQENLYRQVAEGVLSPDAAAAKVLRSLITR